MRFLAFVFGPWLRRIMHSTRWTLLSFLIIEVVFCGGGALLGLQISHHESAGWQEYGAVVEKVGTQPDPNGSDQTYTLSTVGYYAGGIEHYKTIDLQWWEHAGMGVPVWTKGTGVTSFDPSDPLTSSLAGGIFGIIAALIVWALLVWLERAISRYDEQHREDEELTELHEEFASA